MLAHEQVSWQVDCPKQSFVLMLVSMLNVINVYQNDWIPVLGEVLQCSHKVSNAHDPYAVKVMKAGMRAGTMVGHLPKKTSSTCSLFIRKGGTIDCEVTDLLQGFTAGRPGNTLCFNAPRYQGFGGQGC